MMLEPSRLQAYVRRPSSVFSPRSTQFDSKHTNFGSVTLPTNLALLTAPKILETGLLVMSHKAPLRVCCLHSKHTPSLALQRRQEDVNRGLMTPRPLRILESCELTLLGTIRFLLPLITLSILTRSEPPVHGGGGIGCD